MTPTARLWREDHIALWSRKVAVRRAAGARVDHIIADCLDGICARLRAELDAAPATIVAPPTEAPAAPAFNLSTLFGGPASVRHRLSAAACRRIGETRAADAFDRLADQCAADEQGQPASPAAPALRPPPDPTPFAAGPQMDLL